MTTHNYPCHDPHRVDAILACMLDAMADHAPLPDASAIDLVGRDALLLAIDRRALVLLLPFSGRDDDLARDITAHVLGIAGAPLSALTAGCLAVVAAVASRLALTAIAIADHPTHPSDHARWLWRAAERLTGLGEDPAMTAPRDRTSVGDSFAERRDTLGVASIVDFFAAAGVPCEVLVDIAPSGNILRPRIGRPVAEQVATLERVARGELLADRQPPPRVVVRTEGRRKIVITYHDGRSFALAYSVVGEDD